MCQILLTKIIFISIFGYITLYHITKIQKRVFLLSTTGRAKLERGSTHLHAFL